MLQTRQKYAGGLSPGKYFSRRMQQNLPKRHVDTLVKTGSYYGAFLEACYNGTRNDYEQVGLQAQKTVESVYRGEKRTSDSTTQENIKALRTMVEALPDAR